jgi:hypothetical protein
VHEEAELFCSAFFFVQSWGENRPEPAAAKKTRKILIFCMLKHPA